MKPTLDLVDSIELMRQLGIEEKKLRELRTQRIIPFTKLGYRTIRYSVSAVKEALDKQTIQAISA